MHSIVIACIVLIIALFAHTHYFQHIVKNNIQLAIGILIVCVVLFENPIAGLILGISVFIMYYRIYSSMFGIHFWDTHDNKGLFKEIGVSKSLLKDYVTEQHLEDVQSNVVVSDSMNTPIIGIEGMYGFPVYSAQGIDTVMPGISDMQLYSNPKFDGVA